MTKALAALQVRSIKAMRGAATAARARWSTSA